MGINATFIFAIIGLVFGGFGGLILGVLIGLYVDRGSLNPVLRKLGLSGVGKTHTQAVFFRATFQLLGYIAKADGQITPKEIRAAENVMMTFKLQREQRIQAMNYFYDGKRADFDWHKTVKQLKRYCWMKPSLLKNFIEVQLSMATADGKEMNSGTRHAMQNLFNALGIPGLNFDQFERQYNAQFNYKHRTHNRPNPFGIRAAFDVLGVKRDTDHATVKRAYRKLMSENHPDKLIAKGVPEHMIKRATEKTQRIKQAYEDICAAKGW